ncbi:hypothetical protein JHK85_011225 [Glycine max]|nr:hypothetical protein JHK85_011225 [Glycine max]
MWGGTRVRLCLPAPPTIFAYQLEPNSLWMLSLDNYHKNQSCRSLFLKVIVQASKLTRPCMVDCGCNNLLSIHCWERKAEPFTGSFPVLGPPTAISGKVHQKCAASLNAARMILSGYDHNIDEGNYNNDGR